MYRQPEAEPHFQSGCAGKSSTTRRVDLVSRLSRVSFYAKFGLIQVGSNLPNTNSSSVAGPIGRGIATSFNNRIRPNTSKVTINKVIGDTPLGIVPTGYHYPVMEEEPIPVPPAFW